MTLLDLGEGVLRLFGCFYAVASVFLLNMLRTHLFMDRTLEALSKMSAELSAEAGEAPRVAEPNDSGRTWWMIAGGVLLLVAGVTMALGLRVSVISLGVLVIHQLLYFIRQRRLELAAATPEGALEAQPTRATRNGFLFCLLLFVLAGWLERSGVLS